MGRIFVLLGVVAATLVAGFYGARRVQSPPTIRATLSLAEAVGGASSADGFARALAPRAFAFPADHGPHPDYRTEWWYYAGNLDTAERRHFGFELTFFRTALAPRPGPRGSAWGATQIYLAHFAVTDVAGRQFHAAERVSRGALDLAGARATPFRVWVEDWSVEAEGLAARSMRLRAEQEAAAIDLRLESMKPPVLEGDRGLSRKGVEPGNASYYYSLSRMAAKGVVRVGGERFAVKGLGWMDREWSTSALERDQVGWDWFSLQLADGREVTFYRLRRRDGSVDPASRGTLVQADGSTRVLAAESVRIDVLDHWASPRDGTRYPARWRLAIPDERLELDVVPYLADQEVDLVVRYWEGAVGVIGRAADRPVAGEGYVELTGYAGAGRGPMGRAGGS